MFLFIPWYLINLNYNSSSGQMNMLIYFDFK